VAKLKKILPLFILSLLLIKPSPVYSADKKIIKSKPELKKLVAEKDTSVNSAYPDSNFGTEKKLSTGFTNSSNIMFLKFRLEGLSIESFADDDKAILNLWLEESTGELKNIETEILLPNIDWEEEELTWNNKPSLFSSEIPVDLEATPGAIQIDITDLVKQWLNQETENTGIAFYYSWENFSRLYAAREDEKHPPILVIGKEQQAQAFLIQETEKTEKQSVIETVKTGVEKVRGVKIAQPTFGFNSLFTVNSIIPGIMLWTSCVFVFLLKAFKEFPL